MKAAIILPLLFSFSTLFAQLPFYESASVFEHLHEVNKEWSVDKITADSGSEKIAFASETERIRYHLNQVVKLILTNNNSEYSADQLAARHWQMEVLSAYAEAGLFPINTRHNSRVPYFVDDFGTACAVGHLALQSGANDLVNQIKTENNYAYIKELEYPELNTWAANNGLSMDDLALIQPSYSPDPTTWYNMGDGSGIDGVIHGMATIDDELVMVGNFSSVHGHNAKNIIRWNGEEFLNFDVDIDGEIYAAMRYLSGGANLLIAGDFLMNGVRTNIANYQNGEWTALQTGEMNGAVHTLIYSNNIIIAGGTFEKINGEDFPYLAAYENGSWGQTLENSQAGPSEAGAFSVSGPVYDLDYFGFGGGNLLVSGEFNEIQTKAENSEAIPSKNMAFWGLGDNAWSLTFDGDYGPVKAAGIVDGTIFFGGDVESEGVVNQYSAGLYSSMKLSTMGSGQIHDFYSIFGNTFMIGGVRVSEDYIIMNHRRGMFELEGDLNAALFDDEVHCMSYYQGNYYVAGDFKTINGEDFNNLAYSTLERTTSVNEQLSDESITIYAADGLVYCEANESYAEIDLRLYDSSGRLVGAQNFENTLGREVYDPELDSGIYFYELRTDEGWSSGKIFVGNGE